MAGQPAAAMLPADAANALYRAWKDSQRRVDLRPDQAADLAAVTVLDALRTGHPQTFAAIGTAVPEGVFTADGEPAAGPLGRVLVLLRGAM